MQTQQTQSSFPSPKRKEKGSPGGALRDDTKNGCVADYWSLIFSYDYVHLWLMTREL